MHETTLMPKMDGSQEASIDGLKSGPYRLTVMDKEFGASVTDVFFVA